MPGQVIISATLQLNSIVVAAGGDPIVAFYQEGTLFVPDVTQAALDAAVAAHNDAAAVDAFKDAEIDAATVAGKGGRRLLFELFYLLDERLRVLESAPAITRAQFKNQIKTVNRGLP